MSRTRESGHIISAPDVPRWGSLRERLNREDRKLFQILAMLIATRLLCLAMVTLAPSTVRLVISVFSPLAE